ncbi:MAG: hypothetical protein AB8I80_23230 [Anaerolineae bacterium]
MNHQAQDYVSYLLRLWQVGGQDERIWRASLECPRTGKQESFASLSDLFAFLGQETAQQEAPPCECSAAGPEA